MSTRIKRVWIVSLLFAFSGFTVLAQIPRPEGFDFAVISVNVLSDKQAAERTTDAVGYDVTVRVRLSTRSQGLRLYALPNRIEPCRFGVQTTGSRIVWLENPGLDGTGRVASSPGLKQVCAGMPGVWIDLPAHAAVEWEELDSTAYSGENHAFTIFVQTKDKQGPQEVVSGSYTVPPLN
jgi:hypothetical protein